MWRFTAAAVTAILTLAMPSPTQAAGQGFVTEWREVFAEDGSITRVRMHHRVPNEPSATVQAAEIVPIEVNGPSASRFDLVFVGDGYTSAQMATYGQHVRSKFNEIMSIEPFRSHRSQFNVWQVNVISPQSGVDNDPTRGVLRTTALDMYFWCGGTERLLCVNETKARQQAAVVGDVDQVIALANSTKYGGAGGAVATASGGHASSGQIAIHELGHSIGGLADEYDYGSGDCYPGGEPRELNVSRLTAAQMRTAGTKWARWLGQTSPDGGVVDAYVGARYYLRCIYRPTSNSIMRTLGRQFNLPGREAMIAAFYRETGLVEAAAPAGSQQPWVVPVGNAKVTWSVDGVPAGEGVSADVGTLGPGEHVVTATVTDGTDWVRDGLLRARDLTTTRVWTVHR